MRRLQLRLRSPGQLPVPVLLRVQVPVLPPERELLPVQVPVLPVPVLLQEWQRMLPLLQL
jgi:hypothetical protein